MRSSCSSCGTASSSTKSIPEQLLIYIGKVAHGDLGYSYFFNQPVLDLILGRVGPTVLLVFSSLVLSVVAGTLLGTLASRRLYGRSATPSPS